jgi:N-acetyl-anhydromuramyl-L-alanine amidase AmpD
MTGVGALLLALDGKPAPRVDGLTLPLLAAPAGPTNVDAVFATRAALSHAQWTGIVIHHSGSPYGTASSIAAEHEALNFKGLGHHFIIGNGNGMADGELHVGYRWLDQLPGAHAAGPKGDETNLHSISICLVGDGDRAPFTPAQIRRLGQLVAALQHELNIPSNQVLLHREIAKTRDPGAFFPEADFRRTIAR